MVVWEMHKMKECEKREEKDGRIYIRKRNRIRENSIMNREKITLRQKYMLR